MSPETFPEGKPKVHGKCPDTLIFFFLYRHTQPIKMSFHKIDKEKTTLSKSEVGGLLISKSGTPKKSNDRRPCSFEIVYFKNKTSFLVCK